MDYQQVNEMHLNDYYGKNKPWEERNSELCIATNYPNVPLTWKICEVKYIQFRMCRIITFLQLGLWNLIEVR